MSRSRTSTQTHYRVKESLTPEAAQAIEEANDAAIEFLSHSRFAVKHTCESNLAGTLQYARDLETKLAKLRNVQKLIHQEKTAIKRVRTTWLSGGDE